MPWDEKASQLAVLWSLEVVQFPCSTADSAPRALQHPAAGGGVVQLLCYQGEQPPQQLQTAPGAEGTDTEHSSMFFPVSKATSTCFQELPVPSVYSQDNVSHYITVTSTGQKLVAIICLIFMLGGNECVHNISRVLNS